MNTSNPKRFSLRQTAKTSDFQRVGKRALARWRRFWFLRLVAILIVVGWASNTKADLSSRVAGNADYGPFNGCGCTCPPGPTPISCYCDASNTNRCVESFGTISYSGAKVLGRACSDYGLLKAHAKVELSPVNVGTDFGGGASFSDWITPTIPGFNGLTQAIVKVTFQTRGSRTGQTTATGGYSIHHALQDATAHFDSLPTDDTRTLSALVQIGLGNGFGLDASIDLKAADCHAVVAGEADYDSHTDYGMRITRFEFLDTNGVPLLNVSAVGSSGTLYYGCRQPPVIVTNPQPVHVCGNGLVSLKVSASNSPLWGYLGYQWRRNGVAIPGATNSTLMGPMSAVPAGTYDVIVANGCGSVTSAPAMVTAVAPLSISSQPASQIVCLGGSALFLVWPSDSGPMTFQWRKNGVDIPGAIQVFYSIPSVSNSDAGSYSCVLSNSCGAVTSSNATLEVLECLVLSANQLRVPEGDAASFTVRLSGPPDGVVHVSTTRASGDNNLAVSGGSTLLFHGSDWNVPQPVTLSASIDADAVNGAATFSLAGSGVSNAFVIVTEIDKDASPELGIVALTNGLMQLQIQGYPGSNYVIEAATNLVQPLSSISWQPIGTNVADATGRLQFIVVEEPNIPQRFFRAHRP